MPATLRAVRPRRLLGLTAVAAALAVSACDEETGGTLVQPLASPALVKIVHAVAGAGAVTVSIDGAAPILSNFALGAVAPDAFGRYLEVPDGERRLIVRTSNGAEAINATATLTALQNYTIIAAGTAGATGANAPRFIVLQDNVTAPPANQVRLRVVHAALSRAAVDVYTSPPNTAAATATPVYTFTRRFQNVAPGTAGTVELPSGNFALCITAVGTAPTASGGNCIGTIPTTGALAAGTVATAIARNPNPGTAAENSGATAGPRIFTSVDRRP